MVRFLANLLQERKWVADDREHFTCAACDGAQTSHCSSTKLAYCTGSHHCSFCQTWAVQQKNNTWQKQT